MKTKHIMVAALLVCAAINPKSITRADTVTDWNEAAEAAIRSVIPQPPLRARALAIVNASIYDAVNGITRKYAPYYVSASPPPGARKEAAAAQAAYTTLIGLLPSQAPALDQFLAESLASIPGHQGSSESIARGRAWGAQVAEAILAWRAGDGLAATAPPYLGGTAPGQWRAVPNGGIPGSLPQFASVTPFTMSEPAQFRPGPPPSLDSSRYAADVNEVKAIGRADSTVRTPKQTELSLLWAAVTPLEQNAIIRSVVPARYDLTDTARLFALVNMAGCDAFIAGWDAKYHYGFWRPFHAIRLADTDGNPDTMADPSWTALLATPVHPDYISTHSTFNGAFMGVLALVLGDNIPFTVSSPALPGVTAQYGSFSDAADEVSRSRVWGGIHFTTACQTGLAVGEAIAEQAVTHFLLPRH